MHLGMLQTKCWLPGTTTHINKMTDLVDDNKGEEEDNVENLVDDHLSKWNIVNIKLEFYEIW